MASESDVFSFGFGRGMVASEDGFEEHFIILLLPFLSKWRNVLCIFAQFLQLPELQVS